ncbi:KAP family P-loop NTPase fold protein [Kordiimonas sp.]|uniref:KAP family P-loop NTPase fold protein n=1 Tax=Kordiimonas sp. TaxID=1970157 RepID=UPI003A8E6088
MTMKAHRAEQIDKSDPWARDKLKRKAVAEYLTPLIASIRQPFVVSLHSPYGTGKSFFLECWKADLERQKYKVVLFDAWKTDFSDDPLSAFISSVKQQAAAGDKTLGKKFVDLAKSAGGFLGSRLLPLALESISRKAIGAEGTQELIAGLSLKSHEVSSLLSAVAAEALSAQEVAEKSMEDFKRLLAQIVQDMVAGVEEEDKQKLIIFVDELDRCKPSYAIEVLESIKHLFAVEGTVFVLAFDEMQMKDTIANTYGFNDGGEGYLRKFIDWQFQLPEPSVISYSWFLQEKLFADLKESHTKWQWVARMVEYLSLIAQLKNMTCRELERAMVQANLVFRSQSNWDDAYMQPMGIMLALYVHDRTAAIDMARDIYKANEFVNYLSQCELNDYVNSEFGKLIRSKRILAYFLTDDLVEEMKKSVPDEPPYPADARLKDLYSHDLVECYSYLPSRIGSARNSMARVCLDYITGADKYLSH